MMDHANCSSSNISCNRQRQGMQISSYYIPKRMARQDLGAFALCKLRCQPSSFQLIQLDRFEEPYQESVPAPHWNHLSSPTCLSGRKLATPSFSMSLSDWKLLSLGTRTAYAAYQIHPVSGFDVAPSRSRWGDGRRRRRRWRPR